MPFANLQESGSLLSGGGKTQGLWADYTVENRPTVLQLEK